MFNMKSSSLCWVFLVISIYPESVRGQNIFSDSTGLEGEELTLTCDLSRAGTVSPPNVYGVKSLIVSKLDPGTSTFDAQVTYAVPSGPISNFLQSQMDPTYYNVQAEGLDQNNPYNYGGNQNIMNITVTFKSLRCVDRGTYKCSAEYTVQTGTIYRTENSEQTEDLTIDVQPSLIYAGSSPFESLGYENNQNVTFRCRFQGPPGMEVRWFYKECQGDSFFEPTTQHWPFENGIETTTTPQGSQDCATVEKDSKLKYVQLNRIGINNDPSTLLCWVQCQAGIVDNVFFRELLQWNMTIDYKDPTQPPTTSRPTTLPPTTPPPTTPPSTTKTEMTTPAVTTTDQRLDFGIQCICKLPLYSDGTYPYPDDCHRFIQCNNGQTIVIKCPNGLYFNEDKRLCDTLDNVSPKCQQTATQSNLTTPDVDISNICSVNNWTDGSYPNPYYIQCNNGQTSIVACPNNLVYNSARKLCDNP